MLRLAIFDFDGTLFPNETLTYLLSQWKKQKYSKYKLFKAYATLMPMYIKYKSGINYGLSKEEMREFAVIEFNRIFQKMTEEEINKYFFNSFNDMKNSLNLSVVEEVNIAKAEGFHTVIISGAYRGFLDYIGTELGIDTVIGTEMFFKDGIFDNNKDPDIITGSIKANRLNQHFHPNSINWEESRAYADSIFDLPLLETVGLPVAVRPDNELKIVANQREWRILH